MSYNTVNAEEFSTSIEFVQDWVKFLMKNHVIPLRKKYHKMLDLGCGTCENTNHMAENFKPDIIFGVDESEEFLAFAQNNDKRSDINIYKQCDLNVQEDLREVLKNHSDVDLVVSSCFFHWADDPITIFKTVSSSLSGTVEHAHIAIKKHDAIANIIQNIPKNSKWKKYLQEEYFFPKFWLLEELKFPSDQFLKEITNLNYRVIKECVISITSTFPSYEEEIRFLKWVLPFTKDIPIAEQDEFLQDCWLEMRKDCSDKSARFEHKYDLYLLHAISP